MNDSPSKLGSYLRARRSLVQPEDVGLPRDPNRRVKGLRRTEVASVAAISCDYYLRLEQGRDHQPSDQVLIALGRALTLDDEEVAYMMRLARPEPLPSIAGGQGRQRVDDNIRRLLAQWSHTPAFVADRNHDIVMSNPLARALGSGYLDVGSNILQTVFSPVMRELTRDWQQLALQATASFRYASAPTDRRHREVVGRLSASDADFRRMWARHDARPLVAGQAEALIHGFGVVTLDFQTFGVPSRTGNTLTTFFADAGSAAQDALTSLARRRHAARPPLGQPSLGAAA